MKRKKEKPKEFCSQPVSSKNIDTPAADNLDSAQSQTQPTQLTQTQPQQPPQSTTTQLTQPQQPPQLPGILREAIGRELSSHCHVYFPDTKVWLAATPTKLLHFDPQGQLEQYPWFEVQSITWDEKLRLLRVYWSNPTWPVLELSHPLLNGLNDFGQNVRSWLASTQVVTLSDKTPQGVRICACVLKDPNGQLFSQVVAFGQLDKEGEALADHLEFQVREMAGLSTFIDPKDEEDFFEITLK